MTTVIEPQPEANIRTKAIEIVGLSASLGALFLIINFLHFQYVPVSVILYACIWDTIIASVLMLGAYWFFRRWTSTLLVTELTLTVVASNLLILLYSVMGPTVIDRSLSIYIVEKIDYRGGEVAADAMKNIILMEFMDEYRVADVRMTEQITSGTVKNIDGCLHLTSRGRRLATFTSFFRRNFLPKKRLIGGTITHELTNPLANKPVLVPFKCASTGIETP
ncbi:hypothetical protein [Hyphomonas oceanitis]|uniref:Uncharacterized protein n=1 Tax=Hyphomonas oceanitis SCH89 TaxID=1280953 RepID=A0A059G1N6_9PROT|nr:hypothetical protein [Hyphomonas oceanitis]KDA00336.1 hypothetical protein HOC_19451 [Hyphomonas oceanitis SCH89]